MSLINEALKKAQRLRNESAADGQSVGSSEGGHIAKRGKPRSANSMLILVAGGAMLVVLSMVGTAFWLTQPAKPSAPAPAAEPSAAPVPETTPTPAPTPTLQLNMPVVASPAPTPPPQAAKPQDAASAVVTPPVADASAPSASLPAAATTPAPAETPAPATPIPEPTPEPPQPNERIQQYVDGLRVMGIRSSGTESKVLMNDRVFRVNDIVERALGVKLVAVAPDMLTFTDPNGVRYEKRF